jgi:hypothetical protein
MKYPSRLIDTAATLPAELKVWLRPWRRSNNRCPTTPREIAQIAGPKTLEVPPIKTWADITGQNLGRRAISKAPPPSAEIPTAMSARLEGEGEAGALLVPAVTGEIDRE